VIISFCSFTAKRKSALMPVGHEGTETSLKMRLYPRQDDWVVYLSPAVSGMSIDIISASVALVNIFFY
jgi:hypothetical protein